MCIRHLSISRLISFPRSVLLLLMTIALVPNTLWAQDGHDLGRHTDGTAAQSSEDVLLAPGYGSLGFKLPEPGTYRLPPIKNAPSGDVLLETGDSAELKDLFDDQYVLLSFVYTSCDDVNGCPLATFVMQQIHQKIRNDSDLDGDVRLLTLSFDPNNDSPDVMASYRRAFTQETASWKFLTTESEDALDPILSDYGQAVNRMHDKEGNFTGHFAHVLRVYLIDRDQRIRNIYSVDFLHPELLLTDVRTLMLEQAGKSSVRKDDDDPDHTLTDEAWGELLLGRVEEAPLGLPSLSAAKKDALSADRANLGRELFRNPVLSSNNTLACASCHKPQEGFSQNAVSRAVGIGGQSLRRNSSSLFNVAYQDRLYWDGREFSLDTLVWGKLLDQPFLGNRSMGQVLQRLRSNEDLEAKFEQVFDGEGATVSNVAAALSAYMTTIVSGDSRFDRWYFGGESDALNEEEELGFRVFRDRANCAACHTVNEDYALFTDNSLHNTGIGYEHSMGLRPKRRQIEVAGQTININEEALTGTEQRAYNDLGLYEVTLNPADRWKFRTPSLRNVELTAPYMHDGSIGSLEGVVAYYDRGGVPHRYQSALIQPLGLSTEEKAALVAFLKTLTGDNADIKR